MKSTQHTAEQIITILDQAEKGEQTISAICREHGIAENTFYRWRKTYAGMSVLRILTVMDEFTREGLAVDVALASSAEGVIAVLTRLVAQHGTPVYLRSDNGAEFFANAVQNWLIKEGIKPLYSEPGKPWQNGQDERLPNRKTKQPKRSNQV